MPSSKPRRQPRPKKPKQLFSQLEEVAAPEVQLRYEKEKTAALAAAFRVNPDPIQES